MSPASSGQGAKPSPLPRRDVETLPARSSTETPEEVAQRAKPRLEYEIGETVRVKEGPFADFSGEIIEINEDQLKVKVLVNIFGRETPSSSSSPRSPSSSRLSDPPVHAVPQRKEPPWPRRRSLAVVKIQIPAGQATPAPPVGTALGPHGVAIMDFCKAYNAATENQRGTIVPVEITIFEDRSFTFILKTPPTPVLLRQAAGLDKGSGETRPRDRRLGHRCPGRAEIAQIKMPDLNANDLEAAKLQVAGTARSMGIQVK